MISPALRLLGGYWLEEIRPADLPTLAQLPGLAETLPGAGPAALTELAVEYQRLFGFNLPPYESVFVDPSGMLNAPATALVQRSYVQAGWAPPSGARFGAPDHLGLELLALADSLQMPDPLADLPLLTYHLALWAPVFNLTLERLDPHPFYARLGELTLALILEALPAEPLPLGTDPFPRLPPAPLYRGTYQAPTEQSTSQADAPQENTQQGESLRQVLSHLLTPRLAGLYFTRQDLVAAGIALQLPGGVGDRRHMLKTLLQLAAQYELLPGLFEHLARLCQSAASSYAELAQANPAWTVYEQAWQSRLDDTIQFLHQLDLESISSTA